MLQLLLELAPCLLCGMALGRVSPQLPQRLAPVLLRWGVPISLVGLLLKGGVHSGNLQAALFSLVLTGGGLLITQRACSQRLLPPQALSFSITYDLVGTLVTWSIGPLLLTGERARPLQLLQQLLRTPVVQALLVALPLLLSPWRTPIATALWWPARLVLWLMLLLVGMRLGLLVGQRIAAKGLRPALLIKLLGLPLFTLLVTQSLGWAPLLRDALVLQAAAPTAMSVLLLAEASPPKSRESLPAAQLVLWSTLLSLISVPLWAWLLAQATVAM
jgi:predicted permease